ncbi:reverse transcriptase [Gossypium australe]|uniref:Reverse transcriptase n=1 Tax=Gossypium australe TaxID=47621 RepID=A0A5B6WNQ6_9ROSI|nr:reverse transcriptase [Gossypium australe]
MGRIIASRSHLAFAKVCVNVPIDVVIPRFTTVMLRNGSLTSITINVPWMTLRCSFSNTFNHFENFYPKKVVVKKKVRKPIKVNSLSAAIVVAESAHSVFELSLSILEKGKAVGVSPAPPVSDVIVDNFVLFGSMSDGSDLVAVDPSFVASLNGHVTTTTQMDIEGYLRHYQESAKGVELCRKYFFLIAIYALNRSSKRRHLWTHLSEVNSVVGDADCCTSNMEEFSGFVSLLEVTNLGAQDLIQLVSDDEIETVIFSQENDKALGSDGFSALFFKIAWSIVGLDVLIVVDHFSLTSKLLSAFNATVIVLVPKFIIVVLRDMEVLNVFKGWIEACTTSSQFSISLNGGR